jgi:hypothetical protein
MTRIITPERAEEARLLYDARAVPLKEIEALLGMSRNAFYAFRRDAGWPMRKRGGDCALIEEPALATGDANTNADTAAQTPPPAVKPMVPDELIPKIEAAINREFAHAEHALAHGEPRNAEKTAKTMASLVRSLAELKRVQRDAHGHDRSNNAADEPPARDLAELKAELARRLDRLRRARDAG